MVRLRAKCDTPFLPMAIQLRTAGNCRVSATIMPSCGIAKLFVPEEFHFEKFGMRKVRTRSTHQIVRSPH